MRHSEASCVDIAVAVDSGARALRLTVADDGKGMASTDPQPSGGLGLIGIRERVLANQGELHWHTVNPHGVLLEATFPLETTMISEVVHVN
jgi:signal transduction histidine kinase